MHAPRASGASAHAASAAAPAITPSRITGTRSAAAPRMNPVSAACSNPPMAASTPTGSSRVGLVQGEPLAHDIHLARIGRGVHAGAPAGRCRGIGAGERADQRGGGRGVGDTHVAGDQAPVPRGDQVARHLEAGAAARRAACSPLMAGPAVKSALPRATLRGSSPAPARGLPRPRRPPRAPRHPPAPRRR